MENKSLFERLDASTGISALVDDIVDLHMKQVQIEIWRRMSPESKAQLVAAICRGVHEAAVEGVRQRHQHAGPREQFLRLAMLRQGHELTIEAFPDAANLQ